MFLFALSRKSDKEQVGWMIYFLSHTTTGHHQPTRSASVLTLIDILVEALHYYFESWACFYILCHV